MTILTELIIAAAVLFLAIGILTKGRFFFSISNRVKSAAEDIAEATRDPVADGKQAIATAEEEVNELKAERRTAREDILTLENELRVLEQSVDKYEQLAKAAGARGEAGDVRTALERRDDAQTDATLLKGQIGELNTLIGAITTSIDQREEEIRTAKSSSKTLVRSIQFNKIKTRISNSKLSRTGPNASLDRLRQDAQLAAVKSQVAQEESVRVDGDEALEAKYATSSKVSEEEVARYMGTPATVSDQQA